MTGPEHYRESERIDSLIGELPTSSSTEDAAIVIAAAMALAARAQVHATLALAAATAEPIAQAYDSDYDTTIPRAWSEAVS